MHNIRRILRWLTWTGYPLMHHGVFCAFMVILFWTTCIMTKTLTEDAGLYIIEFALDIYLLCTLLCLLPKRWAQAIKYIIYSISYILCIVEAFLYARFYLTFSPTMLNLVMETNSSETSEFLSMCLKSSKLVPTVLPYLGILCLNILAGRWGYKLWFFLTHRLIHHENRLKQRLGYFTRYMLVPASAITLLIVGISPWTNEKAKMLDFLSLNQSTLAERTSQSVFYSPPYRLLYSLKFVDITRHETEQLIDRMNRIVVDSCDYTCPNIVVIIGESYNKHHAQIYGYPLKTTPNQMRMVRQGSMTVMTDVVTPWNVTSNAFKNFLSTHSTDQDGNWTDGVLFPAIFRRAGYQVAFITNQFYRSARQSKADFNGSFFLNDRRTDSLCFDYRNTKHYLYDGGLKNELKQYKPSRNNLYIYHLMGQHVDYFRRTPDKERHFTIDDIKREDLTNDERQIVADYDNATRYNDKVLAQICQMFKSEDAIIIYFADHGDEVYDGNIGMYGRNHSASLTPEILRGEFEIPFVVWCSRAFRRNHRDIFNRIRQARALPFSIDDLPHLLMGLAGIHTTYYDPRRDLLHKDFDPERPRPIKGKVDYNQVCRD